MPETNNNNSQGMIPENDSVPFCVRLCGPHCFKWESGDDGKLRPKFAHKKCLIFTVILAVASLATALWLRLGRLDSQKYVLGIDDQRTFVTGHGDFSAMFCSKYDLHQTDSSLALQESHLQQQNFNPQGLLRAYMLQKSPSQSPLRHTYSRNYKVEISSTSEYMYTYQLSDDSFMSIDVSCSASSALTVFAIQEKHFFKWRQDSQKGLYCSSCIYDDFNLRCFSSVKKWINYYEPSEYVFIFQDLTLFPGTNYTAYINFTLFRKPLVFNDDDVVSSCTNVSDCQLSVPFAADTLLLQMETDSPASSVTLETRCHPKIEMYLAYFLAVPLLLLLIPMALVWCMRKCHEDVLRETQNADNARSMDRLNNGPPPAYAYGNPPRVSTPSRSHSVFTMFTRGRPTSQQLPLIDYDVTSEDSETGVARSPPAYGAIHTVSIPRLDQRRPDMLEVYSSTPPPDYTDALSSCSQDETTA